MKANICGGRNKLTKPPDSKEGDRLMANSIGYCPIWGEEYPANAAREVIRRIIQVTDSPRAGGRYQITYDAVDEDIPRLSPAVESAWQAPLASIILRKNFAAALSSVVSMPSLMATMPMFWLKRSSLTTTMMSLGWAWAMSSSQPGRDISLPVMTSEKTSSSRMPWLASSRSWV